MSCLSRMMSVSIKTILLVLLCAFLGAFGQVFFKLASKDFSFDLNKLLTNYYFFIGIFLYGLSAILFIFALKHGQLSILYPIIATSYIWVSLLSYFIFNESLNYNKIFGILLIIVGICLITKQFQ